MSKVCSFTGHRIIKDAHESRICELLVRAIKFAYDDGCREFLTGGALGFDTLAAKEVIKFRQTHRDVRLILCLPCTDQAEGWSDRDQSLYNHILTSADEIVYASDSYTEGCMRERNFLLASRCDILIAYCGRTKSGSAQTLRMADAMGKEIINIYDALD
jgi:uncharacterized phage-like protein YoqJ